MWVYEPLADPGARTLLWVLRAHRAQREAERAALARSLKVHFPEDDP
jgi:hypothetical protein